MPQFGMMASTSRWRRAALSPESPAGPVRTPCFGREGELEVFGRLLDEARVGTTHFVVIEGEAGMGKSRLLDEIVAHPGASSFCVHRARAEELQPRPFGLLADALAIDPESSDPDRVAVARLLDAGAETAGKATDQRYRVIEGIINLVERAAISGPVLLAFDDVHWSDPSSTHALHVLCRRLAFLPVIVLMACRPLPRPQELARLLDTLAEVPGRHLRLDPLGIEAVTALAASKLEADPGPVLRARLQSAAGNPLFVLELLDALSEEGTIKIEADVAETNASIEPPPSLRMTVLRRLAFLSPSALELLRTASLLGGSFSAAQLSLVTGNPLVDVLSNLEEPTVSGFVTASGEAFAFRHDVVREALYLEISSAVRKGLHLHVGRVLASAGAHPAEVANHLALGAEFGDQEAVAWLRRAARALRSRAPAMAVQFLERASSLLPPDDDERPSLVREEVRTLAVAGRVLDAEKLIADALGRTTDPQSLLWLSVARVKLLMFQFRLPDARNLARRLLGDDSVPAEVRAELMAFTAVVQVCTGNADHALAGVDELSDFVKTHPYSLPAAVCSAVHGYATQAQGFVTQGAEFIEQAVAASADSPHRTAEMRLYHGWAQIGMDAFDEALATFGKARAELEHVGYIGLMQEYHWFTSRLHFLAGRWDDALAEMATFRRIHEETGPGGFRLLFTGDPSPLIHLNRGDLSAARLTLAGLEEGPTFRNSALSTLSWMEPMRALIQEGSGQTEQAHQTFEAWRDSLLSMTFLPDYRGFARTLARICRTRDNKEWLDRMATETAEMDRRAGGVASVRGTALLVQGMIEEDPNALLAAVEAFRASPRLFDRAEACAEAGLSLLSRGRDGEARALVAEAFDLYGEMGARRAEAAFAGEIRSFGIRRGARGRRQRPISGWSALTATEERIVRLVAEGLTNGEIGDRLYTSRGTVATHLRSVFRKLEVSSRAELAAQAGQHLA